MTGGPVLVVFLGGLAGGPAEQMVGTARWAASLDGIEAALGPGACSSAVLVTDDPFLRADVPGVTVDCDGGPYHFGRRLAGVLRRHDIRSVVYMGGGSVPLFGAADFASLADKVVRGGSVANNVFSSDVVGFPVSREVVVAVETCDRDNSLARVLAEGAGLAVEALPRTAVTQMDIDGPSDLAVFTLTGYGGGRLQAYLGSLQMDVGAYQRVLPLFLDKRAQVVVAGRVGSHAWQYLERETACRIRMFAEERGMEAEGRAQDRTARSLLGFFLESAGTARFFGALAELGDAAFIDTRVLLAHRGIEATRSDRFLSDMGRWAEIGEPFLGEFTQAAAEAAIPVLLGGHSLMSGGLMVLNEFAWAQRDAGAL